MGVKQITSRTLAFAVALAATLLAGRAHAVAKTWIGSDGGSISTAANWNPAGTPAAADSLLFANGAVGSTYDINFDTSPTVTQLTVATNPLAFAGPTRTLSLTSTSTINSSRALLIGRTGSGTANAALTTSLAQLNAGTAVLGADSGSTGTLNVTAGAFNITSTTTFGALEVGYWGTGTINVTGGADVTVAGDTEVGYLGGSVGNISIIGSGSTWTNTGTINTGKGTGTISVVDGATLSANGGLTLFISTLAGNSNVTGAVTNTNGTIAPSGLAASYGALHITGSYTQYSTAKLQIELGGTTAGSQYDRLNVTGPVTLAGTLQVTLSSFTPAQNNVFDILDFTSRTGTFATVSLPTLPGSLEWDTSKLYTDGSIRVTLPGDFNNSGTVDSADYLAWRKGLGTTYTQSDFTIWRTHFGRSATGSGTSLDAVTSIPEPATILLFSLATLAISISRVRFFFGKGPLS